MDSTPAKRKYAHFQHDYAGPCTRPSSETIPFLSIDENICHVSVENPSTVETSSSSFDQNNNLNSVQRSRLTPKGKPNFGGTNISNGTSRMTGNAASTSSVYFKPPRSRGPFLMDTPCFSNETPLILATARQTGSSIITSCNTDSIRQLQNPYSDRVAASSVSSEYFEKRTPSSGDKRTPSSGSKRTLSSGSKRAVTSSSFQTATSRLDSGDDISDADVSQIRHNGTEDNLSTSSQSQNYMGVTWNTGKLGVAYYDLDTTIVRVMLDTEETEDFKLLNKVLREIRPAQIVVSSKQDERTLKVLRNYAAEMCTGDISVDSNTSMLQFLPSIDFSTEICKRRVISMDLPSVPEHYVDAERTMYVSSLIPFENVCMMRAMGGLLKYLEKMRIGIELEEAGTRLPVLDVKIVTLDSQMIIDDASYSALQIFQRESHPSVYKTGTSNSAKEGLSLFGIMNRTKSQLGSRMLRTWFQRPLKDKAMIESRHASISYFINPRNFELVSSLHESVKNVKNISKILRRMMTSQASVADWQVLYKTVYNATAIMELCRPQSQSVEIMKKVSETFSDDLHQITNYINKIVDFQECSLQNRFVVRHNVNENLDNKKRIFSGLPEYLTEVAYQELNKLEEEVTECSILYIPQVR